VHLLSRIDDEFVERLADSEAAATIEELDLSRTYITDVTLQRLLSAFPQLRYLASLLCGTVPLLSSS
jgi:hypothetical protein